jgi:subtilisin-like proprotein convertase family protein
VLALPVLALSVALGVAHAASSAPTPSLTAAVPATHAPPPAVPQAVLYDQYNNADSFAMSSQNFEPANDAFDDFLADDFVIPDSVSWSISSLEANGLYYNGSGPASSFNVFFYYDNSSTGLPGALAASRLNQSFALAAGDFQVTLSPSVFLNPGHYWVSVQANENSDPNGQWGWINRTVASNQGAAWQDPGGGFGFCQAWTRATSCGGRTGPDQVFRLNGTTGTPNQYLNPNAIVLNDGTAATAYPSTVDVSGLTGTVTKVVVSLSGFSHTFPQDVDVLLVGPGGQQATIMSDAGGTSPVSNLVLSFDDAAGGPVPAPAVSGVFQPTNIGTQLDSFPLPAPVVTGFPTGSSALSVFNGTQPTGTWRLYVLDDTAGDTGTLNSGWAVFVTTTGSSQVGFGNAALITINDRANSGTLAASAYPSSIVVGGFAGTVSHMTVKLNGFRHTFPDDADLLLVGPGGQNAIVMSDVGGSDDTQNVDLTLDDLAGGPLPDSGPLFSGAFQPANNGGGDTFPAPAPAPSGGSALSTFTGTSPNGTWNLWVVDDGGDDSGYFTGGWSLNFSGPTALEIASLSAAAGRNGVLVRWRTVSEARIAGFNVYRGAKKLNGSLIAARHGGEARGAQYRFLDRSAGTHLYRLELVRRDGTRTFGGRTLVATGR